MQRERYRLFSLAAVVVASVLFGMVVAGALNITTPASADRTEQGAAPIPEGFTAPDFATLADRVVPSVVSVFSTEEVSPSDRRMPRDPFHFFFGPRPGPDDDERERDPMVRRSSGSGFLISADGEIITNNHVVEDAVQIRVRLVDETEFTATVVGRDPATDIALLKLEDADREFPFLELGDSSAVRVGEWVMAVGNPLQMDHTVTVGVVSGTGRVLGLSDTSFENFIQTDAAINLGNSGGPLVNLRGRVIGINTAINAAGENLGFAVPVNIATRILPQLRDRGRVVRGYLGISVSNLDQAKVEAFGLDNRDGAFVEEVLEGHAAAKGGVRKGDVIVTVGGVTVEDTRDLIDTVSAMPPGTEVALGVIRNGKRITLEVELEERVTEGAEIAEDEDMGGEDEASARVGITVNGLTSRLREYYGYDSELEGVVITRVKPVSPAGEEGLVRGDLITEANGVSITTPDDLMKVIDKVAEGGYLRLYVYRPGAERSFFAILKLDG